MLQEADLDKRCRWAWLCCWFSFPVNACHIKGPRGISPSLYLYTSKFIFLFSYADDPHKLKHVNVVNHCAVLWWVCLYGIVTSAAQFNRSCPFITVPFTPWICEMVVHAYTNWLSYVYSIIIFKQYVFMDTDNCICVLTFFFQIEADDKLEYSDEVRRSRMMMMQWILFFVLCNTRFLLLSLIRFNAYTKLKEHIFMDLFIPFKT